MPVFGNVDAYQTRASEVCSTLAMAGLLLFEQEITADLPAGKLFLWARLFMNMGATAAAVACNCSVDYQETVTG